MLLAAFWEFTFFSKDTHYSLESAKRLLREAEIHQWETRQSGHRPYLPMHAATHTHLEQDKADLFMGCVIYFLQMKGYPVIVCTDARHLIDIDKGIH